MPLHLYKNVFTSATKEQLVATKITTSNITYNRMIITLAIYKENIEHNNK